MRRILIKQRNLCVRWCALRAHFKSLLLDRCHQSKTFKGIISTTATTYLVGKKVAQATIPVFMPRNISECPTGESSPNKFREDWTLNS